jgi:dihydroxy-acid dehydratase
MPATVMAFARHNRPLIMVYRGTIQPDHSKILGKAINVSECFKALVANTYGQFSKRSKNGNFTLDQIGRYRAPCMSLGLELVVECTWPITMAAAAMGLSLPNSSSVPAILLAKARECVKAAAAIRICLEKNIRPRDLITKRSLEIAIMILMILGGSTNAVIHLLAIDASAEVKLIVDDFQRISDKTPLLASIAPNEPYQMADLSEIGSIPLVTRGFIEANLIDGSTMTITGKY